MKQFSSEEWVMKKTKATTLASMKESTSNLLTIPTNVEVHQYLYDQGFSDGLPLIPPTPERLDWMLTGTNLPPSTVLGKMPPILAPCTVSNVAVNSIMAGCEPKHLRIVIAAVQAMLDPSFNLHGCHATTMGVTPLLIINGKKVARAANLNYKHGALGSGQDNRANATIGRAVKLVLQNCGRSKLGGTESTTIGGPRKFSMALCENYEELERGPWQPFRGNGDDCVTVHAVSSGLDQLTDTKSTPSLFIELMARKISNIWAPSLPLKMLECVVIISPEHYKMLYESGIQSKEQLAELLFNKSNAICQSSLGVAAKSALINVVDPVWQNVFVGIGNMLSLCSWVLQKLASPITARTLLNKFTWVVAAMMVIKKFRHRGFIFVATLLAMGRIGLLQKMALNVFSKTPKMRNSNSIHIVVSGSNAGKFSSVVPGFGCALKSSMLCSTCVTKSIPAAPHTMEKNAAITLAKVAANNDFVTSICDPRGVCDMKPTIQALRKGFPPKTLGLLDISKPGGSLYFDRLVELMKLHQKDKGVITNVKRYRKPTFSKQCPMDLRRRIASECDAVVLALAD
jgi:hypothetical protein